MKKELREKIDKIVKNLSDFAEQEGMEVLCVLQHKNNGMMMSKGTPINIAMMLDRVIEDNKQIKEAYTLLMLSRALSSRKDNDSEDDDNREEDDNDE